MTLFSRFCRMVLAISLFSSFALGQAFAQRGGGTAVLTAFVEEEVVADTTLIPGAVIAAAPLIVSALRGGQTIISDELQIGSFIRAGTEIARQDSRDIDYDRSLIELQMADAEARLADLDITLAFNQDLLEVAQTQFKLLQQKEARAQSLLAKKALSQEAAETAAAATLNAKQQLVSRQQAIANLQANKTELQRNMARFALQIQRLQDAKADTIYTATANGLILSLPNFQTGFARQGDMLATIQTFGGFEVEAEIPASYLTYVREMRKISATSAEGDELTLIFRAALPQENQRTATRPVRFTIEGDLPRALAANGARLDLAIPIRDATATLLVPQDAIVPVAGGHVVFVYDEGTAARQIVRLGGAVGDRVIIQSGLQRGEKVIIKGNEGLTDGAAVKEGEPPKRRVPSGEEATEVAAPVEAPLETELADDAVEWMLAWSTPRGDSSAVLTLSSKANLYDGEAIRVSKEGDKIAFDAEVVLPFGILTFSFDGTITGKEMAGVVTLSGLPNGRTPSFDFTGKVK